MEFATEYRFCDGVDILEESGMSADRSSILFRANMRRRTEVVSFVEMSKFLKEQDRWYYVDGKLVDIEEEA